MTRSNAGGSGPWQERARATLEQVDAVYGRLGELSRELVESVGEGEVEHLFELLERRAELIEELELLAGDYEAAVDAFTRGSSELPDHEREALAGRMRSIDARASEITDCDAEVSRTLERRRGAMASELAEMGNKSAAVNAYAAGRAPSTAPRFQDREG